MWSKGLSGVILTVDDTFRPFMCFYKLKKSLFCNNQLKEKVALVKML